MLLSYGHSHDGASSLTLLALDILDGQHDIRACRLAIVSVSGHAVLCSTEDRAAAMPGPTCA
jgi:hypothetical protein